MKVEVQLINEKGYPVPTKSRAGMPVYRGILRIREERDHSLGRITVSAQLLSNTDTSASPVLPALRDATLLYLNDGRLRLAGVEVLHGVQYAQTWDAKVVSC